MAKHSLYLVAGVTALAHLAAVSGAEAGAFQIRGHSAAGFGMALAGAAAGGQLSYSYWNPATLADIESLEIENVAGGVFPRMKIEPDATTNWIVGAFGGTPTPSVDIGKNAIVPAGFAALPLTEDLTVGVAITSPFGLATRAPHNWSGQIYARDSKIFSINVNPMASYRINHFIAVGGGVQVQYFDAELTQAIALSPGAPDVSLRADDISVGFNLGLQIKPWGGGTLGIGYRSTISHSLEGRLLLPGLRLPIEATLKTPDIISAGLRQEISDRFRLMGTVEWTNWSRLKSVPVISSGTSVPITMLHLNYRDGWLFSAGGEFDLTDAFTVRAGAGYETSPLTDMSRDIRLPEVNQVIVSAGMSYRHSEQLSFDLGYTYSRGRGTGPINIGPGDPRSLGLPFQASSRLDVSILTASMNIKFDSTDWALAD